MAKGCAFERLVRERPDLFIFFRGFYRISWQKIKKRRDSFFFLSSLGHLAYIVSLQRWGRSQYAFSVLWLLFVYPLEIRMDVFVLLSSHLWNRREGQFGGFLKFGPENP